MRGLRMVSPGCSFTRMPLHARLHPQAPFLAALHAGAPLARPADGGDHAAAGPIEVEERTDVGGAAVDGGKVDPLAAASGWSKGSQSSGRHGLPLSRCRTTAAPGLGNRTPCRPLDLFQDRRFLAGRDWRNRASNPRRGCRCRSSAHGGLPARSPHRSGSPRPHPRRVDRAFLHRAFPFAEQFRGRSAAVDKREWQSL